MLKPILGRSCRKSRPQRLNPRQHHPHMNQVFLLRALCLGLQKSCGEEVEQV